MGDDRRSGAVGAGAVGAGVGDAGLDHGLHELDEFGVDELARRAGTPVRNVRLYQERELLPRPRRQGRHAFYGEHHLHRLQLVLRLMGRGYSMSAIKELTQAWDAEKDLAGVLGLHDALAAPFVEEEPGRVGAEELLAMFPSEDSARDLARAIDLGLVVPDGDGFSVPSPAFLQAGAELVATGVPVSTVLDIAEQIQRATASLAGAFVDMFLEHIWKPFEEAGEPPEQQAAVAEVVNRQRRQATKAVVAALGQALQARVDDALMMDTEPPSAARREQSAG